MIETKILSEIESGVCYWHWPTGLIIFHDEVYDEPPYSDGDTFGMSVLDLNTMHEESVWDGYAPSNDDDVSRDDAAQLIAGTKGWAQTGEDDSLYVRLAKASSTGYDCDPVRVRREIELNWTKED